MKSNTNKDGIIQLRIQVVTSTKKRSSTIPSQYWITSKLENQPFLSKVYSSRKTTKLKKKRSATIATSNLTKIYPMVRYNIG